jgi:two-component system KDP operon response regulator KdpE
MGCTILVIDDVEFIAKSIASLLRKEGHEVFTAHTAADAHEILDDHTADVIICDMMLPDEQGAALISRLRPRTSAIVAITGGSEDRERDLISEATRSGAAAVLVKPVSRVELLHAIKKL